MCNLCVKLNKIKSMVGQIFFNVYFDDRELKIRIQIGNEWVLL